MRKTEPVLSTRSELSDNVKIERIAEQAIINELGVTSTCHAELVSASVRCRDGKLSRKIQQKTPRGKEKGFFCLLLKSPVGQIPKQVRDDSYEVTRVGFTMAEILLSLTIIGVVAAITLPSLTGNINERTWNTQRKALFARFSQAIALMPSINGYGTVTAATSSASAVDTAAETFITSGLAKVLKINNICSPENVTDCGFTSQQITNGAGSRMDLPQVLTDLNNGIAGLIPGTTMTIKNTHAAAFETANGESILTFYNPECLSENVLIPRNSTSTGDFIFKQQVCVNFVFDLNGKNGPNTFGKDIGVITVVYPSDSKVVMPMYPRSAATGKTYQEATNVCKGLSDGEYRLPNLEEMISIYYNKFLVGGDVLGATGNKAWTTSTIDSNTVYTVGQAEGVKYSTSKLSSQNVACVQR